MKDLLSKEHYCVKIHTLLMKSSTYPTFYRQPPTLYVLPPPPYLQRNLDPLPFHYFSQIPTSPPPPHTINKGGEEGSHYAMKKYFPS